jgi:hypothetical protein
MFLLVVFVLPCPLGVDLAQAGRPRRGDGPGPGPRRASIDLLSQTAFQFIRDPLGFIIC